MRKVDHSNPLATVAAGGIGIAVGLVLQFSLTNRGAPTLIPPLSLGASILLIAGVILVFGIRLRRTIVARKRPVDAFHAVRVLATARAGQLVGALLGGFGAGLLLALLGRSVPAPFATWGPMAFVFVSGAVLVICSALAEHFCKVPPGADGDETGDDEDDRGIADQPAFRKP